MKEWIKRLYSAVLCLTLLLTLIPANVYASKVYDYNERGSITVQLHDLGTPVEGTKFAIYQVGAVTTESQLTFALTSEFAASGVDLNALNSAADQKSASQTLAEMLPSSALEERAVGSDGKAVFANLDHGVYLLYQTDTAEYGTVTPFLIFLPHMNEGHDSWVYHIVTNPKGEAPSHPLHEGEITVNKQVMKGDLEQKVSDTFYFTLFSDKDMKQVISTKSLTLKAKSAGTVVFDKLLYGTYYIAETDANGVVVGSGFKYDVTMSKSEVILSETNQKDSVEITNKEKESKDTPNVDKPGVKTPNRVTTKTTSQVKTGDSTGIVTYVLIALLALVVILGGVLLQKKQRNH